MLNGPYVHNKLSYVFFPSSSSGHSSYLQRQVTGRANVTAAAARRLLPVAVQASARFSGATSMQNRPAHPADGTTVRFSGVAKSTFHSSHSNGKKGATFMI